MNLIRAKLRVFGLFVSNKSWMIFVNFDTVAECDRPIDRRTDISVVAVPALA